MTAEANNGVSQSGMPQRPPESWFRPLADEPEVLTPSARQVELTVAFMQHASTRELATMGQDERRQKLDSIPFSLRHQLDSFDQFAMHLGEEDWDTIAQVDPTRSDVDQEGVEAAVHTLSLHLARLELRSSKQVFAFANPCFGYAFIDTW